MIAIIADLKNTSVKLIDDLETKKKFEVAQSVKKKIIEKMFFKLFDNFKM